MNLPLRLATVFLFSLFFVAAPALRADPAQEATAMIESAVEEALAILHAPEPRDTLAERLRPTLEKHFSFEATTRRAVGPGWRQFTPEQRKRTVELFSNLIIETYTRRLTGDERPRIAYGNAVALNANRVEVPSTITYQGQPYSVAYRMEKTDTGWRIMDVVVEGVSMISNYRSQLDALFRRGGAAEIIRVLETKLQETTSTTTAEPASTELTTQP